MWSNSCSYHFFSILSEKRWLKKPSSSTFCLLTLVQCLFLLSFAYSSPPRVFTYLSCKLFQECEKSDIMHLCHWALQPSSYVKQCLSVALGHYDVLWNFFWMALVDACNSFSQAGNKETDHRLCDPRINEAMCPLVNWNLPYADLY